MKAEYKRDNAKNVFFRHSSNCCRAELTQKVFKNGKLLKNPIPSEFQSTTSTRIKRVNVPTFKKWWQFWKPKETTVERTYTTTKGADITYEYYCTDCDQPDNGEWSFKYDSGNTYKSKGAAIVAVGSPKADTLGAEPNAPAKLIKENK